MDIAAMSVVMSNQKVRSDASLAIMRNTKDVVNQQGEQLIKMLEQSVPEVSHPTLGKNIDIKL